MDIIERNAEANAVKGLNRKRKTCVLFLRHTRFLKLLYVRVFLSIGISDHSLFLSVFFIILIVNKGEKTEQKHFFLVDGHDFKKSGTMTMKKYLIIMISLLLVGCKQTGETGSAHEKEEVSCLCPPTIVLQPCNRFTVAEAQQLVPSLRNFIEGYSGVELDFEVLPTLQLADTLRNKAQTRFRANKIIRAFERKANDHRVMIILTHDDISTTHKGHEDWGVLGLSMRPTYVCVASDFRLKKKKRDLWKVAAHEFIHTYHRYSHCPKADDHCIMKDAKGHANFGNKTKLCHYCDSVLNI